MKIRPIRRETDYEQALALVSPMFDNPPEPGTPEGDEFEVWITLIHAYEQAVRPIGPPDPIEAIKFRMEQAGLSVADLEPMIGARNRVYEVLNKTRPLTLAMIRRVNAALKIPAEVLIQPT